MQSEKQESYHLERLGQLLQFVPDVVEVLSDIAPLTRPSSTELAVRGRPFRIDIVVVSIENGVWSNWLCVTAAAGRSLLIQPSRKNKNFGSSRREGVRLMY